MLDFTPPSIAIQLGPIPIYFYGICYALGLILAYFVIRIGVRARGLDEELLRQRDDHRGDRRPDRRPGLPRDRPVGPVQGRPDQDLPAALRGLGGLRRDLRRDRGHDRVRPAKPSVVLGVGRRDRARACSRWSSSPAGATSSTRSCTARPRRPPGGSRSIAPIESPPISAHPTGRPRSARSSSRCSCTSRSPACSAC